VQRTRWPRAISNALKRRTRTHAHPRQRRPRPLPARRRTRRGHPPGREPSTSSPAKTTGHGRARNRFMVPVVVQEADETGSPATCGEHVTDEQVQGAHRLLTEGRRRFPCQATTPIRTSITTACACQQRRPARGRRRWFVSCDAGGRNRTTDLSLARRSGTRDTATRRMRQPSRRSSP